MVTNSFCTSNGLIVPCNVNEGEIKFEYMYTLYLGKPVLDEILILAGLVIGKATAL